MPVAFKVVCGKRASFRPATSLALQRIRYRIGEETVQYEDHGPFALFETLAAARNFLVCYGDQILICAYEPSEEEKLWKRKPPVFSRNRRNSRGYSISSGGVAERECEDCPEGTVLACAVTPFLVANDDDPDDLVLVPPDQPTEPQGRVIFDAEGGFKILPSDN